MKTLFVTGAEGYTGSHLVPYLTRRGYDVVGGVRNRARKLAFEKEHGRALVCDVADPINVARCVASVKPDGVIHLAGLSQPWAADKNPLGAFQSIVVGWANILDAVRRSAPRAKVILSSASDVYGRSAEQNQRLSEDAPLSPFSVYGSLKLAAENIARTFHRSYHTDITIVRPFQYVGPQQSANFFFAWVANQIANWDESRGDALTLPDLACSRDLLHIDDVVEGYAVLLEEGAPNQAYNLCSGKTLTVREIAEQLVARSGRSIRIQAETADDQVQVNHLCGDPTKIMEQTEWSPLRSAEVALNELYDSFLNGEVPAGR